MRTPERWMSPTEDLMREHGLLDRLLLIYERLAHRVRVGGELDRSVAAQSAWIVRMFVEEYHEQMEETFVFPRLRRGHLSGLVRTLERQHAAGGRITGNILSLISKTHGSPTQVAALMTSFVDMYRPHSAREDTVLFPAWAATLSPQELRRFGEVFERTEEERFGKDGFERLLSQIANMERELSIYDLKQYTPLGAQRRRSSRRR